MLIHAGSPESEGDDHSLACLICLINTEFTNYGKTLSSLFSGGQNQRQGSQGTPASDRHDLRQRTGSINDAL
jgi:hypothetical protein